MGVLRSFLPKDFATAARDLITLPLNLSEASVVPVRASNPLVEVGVISAAGLGTALVCVNWGGDSIPDFTLTISAPPAFKTATLASSGDVHVSVDKHQFTFALPKTAEVLILR